jgi:uncharacterized membrane protein YphA (DoxX/SURF4 family)
MDVLVLIGRILFVVLFLGSALGHLTQTKAMAQYTASKGLPLPVPATIVSGLMMLVGGLMVLLGVWADLGALVLFAVMLPTAVLMHRFWAERGDARQQTMVQFNKDLALAGAALMLFAFFAHTGDTLGLTMTGPLFDLS